MLSIGELSIITKLTIKALRLYHDKGILIPDKIDYDSKYRYYREQSVEKALVIKRLKDVGFSLGEIKTILQDCAEDQDIVEQVEKKLKEVKVTIQKYKDMEGSLSHLLERAKEKTVTQNLEIISENIPDMNICSIRFKGRYDEIGRYLGTLFKRCGRYGIGKPLTLYHDGEYKEENADIEVCLEVKREVKGEGVEYRTIQGGRAFSLVHQGPYEELSRSYQKLYETLREKKIEVKLPTREVYIKGPGFIFRGNPKKYLTKLTFMY